MKLDIVNKFMKLKPRIEYLEGILLLSSQKKASRFIIPIQGELLGKLSIKAISKKPDLNLLIF